MTSMYQSIKQPVAVISTVILMSFGVSLGAQETAPQERPAPPAMDINRILSAATSAAANDGQTNQQREQRFDRERDRQQGELNSMRNERTRQERISDQLDAQFEVNDQRLEELRTELRKELGDLQELFGVIQQTASEAQEQYKTSVVSAHYPDRANKLQQMVAKMASLTQLVSIDEIEELWFHLQNEMVEQGKVVKFTAPVSYVSGTEPGPEGEPVDVYTTEDREVTRIGSFNAVTGNDIATYNNDRGFILLNRQMGADYTNLSNDLQGANSGVVPFMLDPTRGALLSALVTEPSILEKIQEGKVIGYVIITLGIIAFLIAMYRILVLSGVEGKVKSQSRNLDKPKSSNPLGRVLKVYQDNPKSDAESMELKLSEAILKETPKLNSWLMFVKIIAVVAPLLGLLGTVTGMIQTFQAITLFGAGDPQTMAGGISQALVTTVLGLCVAIPTVFMHWLASGRAKRVEQILEETTSGLIAKQIETQGSTKV